MSNNNDDNNKKRDTEVPPPPAFVVQGRLPTIPPPPMFLDDDEAIVQDETGTARDWAVKHPWFSSHSPEILRVTNRGESELRIPPKSFSGSPYGTYNGGLIVTGCLAAAQMAGTHHFGERVSVMSADAVFLAPSTLTLDALFRAEFVKALSKSRILVDATWYQRDTNGQIQENGSMSVILAKARKSEIAPPASVERELLASDEGPLTTRCAQLVSTNPYFSRMGVTITHASKDLGVHAHLLYHERNMNTQHTWADGVLYAFGDALVCYAAIPWVGEKPTTSQLKFERIAQAPAGAVIFGEATVYVEMGRRVKVHGQAYYLNQAQERVIVSLYEAMIVGT